MVKPLFVSLRLHEIHHVKNLLLSAGIRCRIRNENLSTLAGEVPFTECAMLLELEDESERERADALLREFASRSQRSGETWSCPRCGERLESQFTACWKCGAERE